MRQTIVGISWLVMATAAGAQEQHALTYGAPWQVQIYSDFNFPAEELAVTPWWELSHRCGGSLIAPQWVLTAAHCFDRPDGAKGYRVRLGSRQIEQGKGVSYRIERLIRHPGYDKEGHAHDVALLYFAADEKTDEGQAGRIEPIRLSGSAGTDEPVSAGAEVTATGWGKTKFGPDGHFSPVLQMVDMAVLDCEDSPAYAGRTTEDMMCAVGNEGGDSCQGDSGGPLILTYGEPVLVGVVSWGDGCGDSSRPGVYARVDHYLDWIEQEISADPEVSEP